ncbi:Crp/Fnr family transcriptional regulator [Phototrophicus methaneseepsis]|uniref:Crp/Fnr family transcriptional regulator n=1 Tax=Phototrophicus methaneseepsis TaxID=2710758 RepID=A0A7S8EB43_9CHLR|nr:Crp/Fnr family transcriptional regulator [Phototrophicus methaneseepsis]QPC83706.1 Crp/Fnr family transcriptional regulator [Phototrophicus methaneseepsis]
MMKSSIKNYIESIVYFDGIIPEELSYISDNSVLRSYVANEIIFIEGDLAEGLWVVERGRVKIYKLSPEGNEHILHLRGPGKTFNDIGALDGGNNPANAAALSSEVQVWLIPSEVITHILTQNPKLSINVIRLLAKRVRSLVGQIEDLALYSVIVRLARFLIKQVDDPSLSGPGITRTAIAAHLNTTPQTISVALRELESSGAIEFDRHQVSIIDEEKLLAIAML